MFLSVDNVKMSQTFPEAHIADVTCLIPLLGKHPRHRVQIRYEGSWKL